MNVCKNCTESATFCSTCQAPEAEKVKTVKPFFSPEKAEENGITGLYLGGEIINGQVFREKDVLEDDYSSPLLYEDTEIDSISPVSVHGKRYFTLNLAGGIRLNLTQDELDAGRTVKEVLV